MHSIKPSENFLRFVHDNKMDYVDFRFTDFQGTWHHITFHRDALTVDLLEDGIMFDGSSIPGWRGIEDSDLILKPDCERYFMDPFPEKATVVVLGDVFDPHKKEAYSHDPRSIAKKAEAFLQASGVASKAFFGPEPEFFIFDEITLEHTPYQSSYALHSDEMSAFGTRLDGGTRHTLGHTLNPKEGYFPCSPQDRLSYLRDEMLTILHELGLEVEKHHHEVAVAQHELGFRFSTLCQTADHLQMYKYVVRQVAFEHGKTATFMAKPVAGDNGSGMHVHQSLWKDDHPLFSGDVYEGLSQMALYYLGGILHHAKTINAFTNPTTNSYRRLVPGFEAPVYLSYGARNRSTAIRIPHCTGSAKRIEVRFPDPTANPYLAFAALLMAGLDGIRHKMDPGLPDETNLYALDHIGDRKAMAGSLEEALISLEKDHAFLLEGGVFTVDAIQSYIDLKRHECRESQVSPTPWEFKTYYSR